MKSSLIFPALAALLLPRAFCARVEFYTSSDFCAPPANVRKTDVKNSTGIRVSEKAFSATLSAAIPKTRCQDLTQWVREEWNREGTYRWGTSWTASTSILDFSLMAGTLGFSQGISRLRNPAPAVPSPFRKTAVLTPGIGASLPSFTASAKPKAATVQLKAGSLPVFQSAFLESGEFYGSVYRNFSAAFLPSATVAATWARFPAGQQWTDSWHPPKRPFEESFFHAFSGEANLTFAHARTSTGMGLHQNPFGPPSWWARNHTVLLWNDMSLYTQLFSTQGQLLCADGTEEKCRFQFYAVPGYTFRRGRRSIQTGFVWGLTQKEELDRYADLSKTWTARGQVQFNSAGKSLSITYGSAWTPGHEKSGAFMEGERDSTLNIKVRRTFRKATSQTSFIWKNNEKKENTYTVTQTLTPRNSPVKSLSLQAGVERTATGERRSARASLSLGKSTRHFSWTVKASLEAKD